MSSTRKDIDKLLRGQEFNSGQDAEAPAYAYGQCLAEVEGCVVVVSDLKSNSSRIFPGGFAQRLGIDGYFREDSIWESIILDKLSESEQEEKYKAELRFFNFLRRVPVLQRKAFYLVTQLRFAGREGPVDVVHRMYYRYESGADAVRYAICVYGPLTQPLQSKSMAVNMLTGEQIALTSDADRQILSKRELQILSLVETGMTSRAIAGSLCISKHTVSRHRQAILANLQVSNSAEAILRARQLGLL